METPMSEPHKHDFVLDEANLSRNERKTTIVLCLTAVTMVVEIAAGLLTGSMALLADGWHMASHTLALGIAVVVYKLAKSPRLSKLFPAGTGKLLHLGGYTSAVLLAVVAALMAFESVQRLVVPKPIEFTEAIVVAVIGLVVNVVSVLILNVESGEATPSQRDHNLRGAYLHVLADALTSVLAILALSVGKVFHIFWLDAVMGIVGSILIARWAYNLGRDTAWELCGG